ncbi:MAG: hypothetical protein OIN85_06050 [Candidatus Methanoperedens sp.]|nr:hypothetical protein [Candidatus Methanoperedens sp.]
MKLTKKTGILIAIIAIVAILLFGHFGRLGIEIGPILYFGLLIAVGYLIIDGISKFANRLIDTLAKRQAVSNEELNKKWKS